MSPGLLDSGDHGVELAGELPIKFGAAKTGQCVLAFVPGRDEPGSAQYPQVVGGRRLRRSGPGPLTQGCTRVVRLAVEGRNHPQAQRRLSTRLELRDGSALAVGTRFRLRTAHGPWTIRPQSMVRTGCRCGSASRRSSSESRSRHRSASEPGAAARSQLPKYFGSRPSRLAAWNSAKSSDRLMKVW